MTAVLPSVPSVPSLKSPNGKPYHTSNISLSSQGTAPEGDDDLTITNSKDLLRPKKRSSDDLQFLAISAQITEISYNISDVQTRIFEIQELRHQAEAQPTVTQNAPTDGSTAPHPPSDTATANIDQALINLDERLESIAASIAHVGKVLEPILKTTEQTPTQTSAPDPDNPNAMLMRKHAALLREWESVQDEAETLRGELREDKWLAVFRTVGEQAEAMMASLEKAVSHCQDFIWQVHRKGVAEDSISQASSNTSERPVNFEVFQSLQSSYDAKKRYYMPATTKVLSILDRSVRDRVTKNGECLRRHAEARARWKNLRERISRIDNEMEQVRIFLVNKDKEPEPSEAGSAVSKLTSKSNYLSTPSTRSRAGSSSTSAALARSMSPLRRFASKVSSSVRSAGRDTPSAASSVASVSPSVQPLKLSSKSSLSGSDYNKPRLPPKSPYRPPTKKISATSPEPESPLDTSGKKRDSLFPFLSKPPPPSVRPGTASSAGGRSSSRQSMTTDSGASKPKWNTSTKVEHDDPPPGGGTIRASPRRPSISAYPFGTTSTAPSSRPGSSLSRHSPSKSLSVVSQPPPIPPRAPSRTGATSRAGARTPSNNFSTMPRLRPETPSQIPSPNYRSAVGSDGKRSPSPGYSDTDTEPPTSLMQRALSPASMSGRITPTSPIRQRRPSKSLIPAPVPQLNLSRPGSSLSRSTSPAFSYEGLPSPSPVPPSRLGARSQTPEAMLRQRAAGVLINNSPESIREREDATSVPRPPSTASSRFGKSLNAPSSFPVMARTLVSGLGSSFRRATDPKSPITSRPASRSGMVTPGPGEEQVIYMPVKTDELDVEVAKVVNGMAHGFLFERVDPPRKTPAKAGEEQKAQYAISNALGRKLITCRLALVNRGGTETRKVMCRVGGGWLELQMYILNRQAGLS